MASGNAGRGEDDDEVSHHRHFYWSLRDIPKFEGKDEQPLLHLMEFEDYLVASGVRIELEEIRGNMVQPDYQDTVNKFKASLKIMQDFGLECTLRKEYQIYIQQMDGR